jgi:hypothetical protein
MIEAASTRVEEVPFSRVYQEGRGYSRFAADILATTRLEHWCQYKYDAKPRSMARLIVKAWYQVPVHKYTRHSAYVIGNGRFKL